jgi:dCMP deaminase
MANWDKRIMELALHTASWSKDPSRQVGAVIFNPSTHAVISQGYNGFHRGADDSVLEHCDRDYRLMRTAHAEANAIYNAARHGVAVGGMSVMSTLYPCAPCALAITQSGICEVISYEPDWKVDRYAADFAASKEIFARANVTVRFLEPEAVCQTA